MEAAPSAKPRRGSPPIPPNYVSLRQLQELRLKEKKEQEKRQREEEEAARKAEMEAMTAAAVKRDAARKPETKVSEVVSLAPARAKETRDGGLGSQWVAVAHRPAVSPPTRGEGVPEAVLIGVGRGNKGPADAPRGGGKPEGTAKGKGKEKVPSVTCAQTRTADEPGKPAEASSHGGKPENKGEGKGKAKAKEEASGDTSAEPGSIGGSGESTGAPYRRRKSPKGKKGAGGRSAEPSADSALLETAGASPPQGVKLENAGKPKSTVPKRADARLVRNSSHGKNADATSAAVGSVGELRITAETKPEGQRRPPAVEVQGASGQKPRVARRRTWPRPPGDRCNGASEQHGQVWVPKAAAAAGCAEL